MRLPFISRRRFDEAVAQNRRLSTRVTLLDHQAITNVIGALRYERRIRRLRRAVAAERAQAAAYRREIRQLTDRLFDACGYQGEPLIPAARVALGIEDAKEES